MKKITFIVFFALVTFCSQASAKLKVITSLPDFRALVSEIGSDKVQVESIAIGTQDAHFVEAKPSFMIKASKADLIVLGGLDLEVGWIPNIIQGSRNPKLIVGAPGYLELGFMINPIQVPTVVVTRAMGDVHPYGNPHFTLDPIRMGKVAVIIAERMGQLDPVNAKTYQDNARAIQDRLEQKVKGWQERIDKTGIKKIVTFHQTLNYFFDRFGIENVATLEPKPGIPPTSNHLMNVIQTMKAKNVNLVLVENFFDVSLTKKIIQDVPGSRAVSVPVLVDGEPNVKTTDDLIERLVSAIEGKS